ncbi:MAG TPA: DUF1622 domain-containing protein [Tissierellaceae bacterium]
MFEELLEHLVHYIACTVEYIGVIIIVIGILKSLYLLVKNKLDFGNKHIAAELAKALSLSLSFLLASEILHSILTVSTRGVIVLLGIAALRVGLHFVLHLELKEIEENTHNSSH